MPKPDPVLLISSAGRRVELLRCFRTDAEALGLSLRVLGVDVAPEMSPACQVADQCFPVPPAAAPEFISRLLELCAAERVDLLVPTIDLELQVLADHQDKFQAVGTRVAVASPETVSLTRDKAKTAQFLAEHGVPVPRTGKLADLVGQASCLSPAPTQPGKVSGKSGANRQPPAGQAGGQSLEVGNRQAGGQSLEFGDRQAGEVSLEFGNRQAGCLSYSWPILVKPRHGSASKGAVKAHNLDEARFLAARGGDDIVQECWPGREYTVNLFFDREGKLRCAVPHRRIEVRAGEVSKGITERQSVLLDIAQRIGRILPGAYGPLCFQAMLTEDGQAAVFEINARFGGGYPLAHQAGARFNQWLLEDATGLPSTANDNWEEGVVMLRYDAAVFREMESKD